MLQHPEVAADVRAAVGRAVRRAREAAGLSMRALARAGGMSQPFLSQVEKGETSPSLSSLYRLAHALGVPPSQLMPAVAAPRGVSVLRQGDGQELAVSDVPGAARGRLLSGGAGHLLEVVEYDIEPGADLGDWFESDGEMTVYVMGGELEVTLEHEGSWRLGAGEAISHPAGIRHRWAVAGDTGARVLLSVAHTHPAVARR
ncbi:helix-turn-helix domain-containing protein [Myceligenerans indicum]|uniref:Helix-turn-helix transcriptional regulator n=1 Tax=Myceligenerans indicum TaxID=2593663 RepID=A0ABS1LLN4_9MICO|nr:helix-turn-helix domain-containing protein [Myceligenerans indicum]MBL0887156.1 helix-turn-helix transcriptional regulator [Myceligenerans indicum]